MTQPTAVTPAFNLNNLFGTINGLIKQGNQTLPLPGAQNGGSSSSAGGAGLPFTPGRPLLDTGVCVHMCEEQRLIDPMQMMHSTMVELNQSMLRMEKYMAGMYTALVVLVVIVVLLLVIGAVGVGYRLYRGRSARARVTDRTGMEFTKG